MAYNDHLTASLRYVSRLLIDDSHTQISLNVARTYCAYTHIWPTYLFILRTVGAYQTHESRLSIPTAVEQASFRGIDPPAERVLW